MDESELNEFATSVLVAAGADKAEATIVAQILVWADMVGRPNQGVWRLPILCERLNNGLYKSPCAIQVEMKTPSIGIVDADNGMGHYIADFVMKKCIESARETGICMMVVRHSNFFGAAGYYAALAAAENMIGIALSNSFPKVVPYGGTKPLLGTNPLAFACPARGNSPLVLDMATSELAGSTVRKAAEKSKKFEHKQLNPLGGAKGFGLALFVEILSGLISGAGFSHQINSMYQDLKNPGNNGHFFLTINIENIMALDEYFLRMHELIKFIRQSGMNVQYPGENRWNTLKHSLASGINLDKVTLEKLHDLAFEYRIKFNI